MFIKEVKQIQKRPTIKTARHEKKATVMRLRPQSESMSAVAKPALAERSESVSKKMAGTVMAESTA